METNQLMSVVIDLQAKAERHSFKKKIKESQDKLLSERSKVEQVGS